MATAAFEAIVPQLSQHLSAEQNRSGVDFGRDVRRVPEGHVYIHTVAKRQLQAENGPMGRVRFPGAAAGQRYRTVMTLPHPFHFSDYDADKENVYSESEDARRVAMDMLNPNCLGIDQDYIVPEEGSMGDNTDLLRRGMFFTPYPDPTAEDVAKAEERERKFLQGRVDRIRQVEKSNPAQLPNVMNEEGRYALEYFGQSEDLRPMVNCVNCGERKRQGASFHKNMEFGRICCEGKDGWRAAVNAGVVKFEEVPDDMRWAGRPPSK